MKKSLLWLIFPLLIMASCKKESAIRLVNPSDPLVGAWEIIQITEVATGETEDFPEGPHGIIFNYGLYADALELRPNGEFAAYYRSDGLFHADRIDGTWHRANDQLHLHFGSSASNLITVPIIDLEESFLYLLDVIGDQEYMYKMERK